MSQKLTKEELDTIEKECSKENLAKLPEEEQIRVMKNAYSKLGLLDKPIRELYSQEEWANTFNEWKKHPSISEKLTSIPIYREVFGEAEDGVDKLFKVYEEIFVKEGKMFESPRLFTHSLGWLIMLHVWSQPKNPVTIKQMLNRVESELDVLRKTLRDMIQK